MSKKQQMFAFLLLIYVIIFSLEKVETIRLEYKYLSGKYYTYSEIQIIERHDFEKGIDESIEYIEMNYTEYINEIDSIKNIKKQINSIRIIPNNEHKIKQLSETTYLKFGEEFLSRPAELSSIDGHILLSSPDQPNFPENDIEIGGKWVIPIMNLVGEIHYNLIDIDKNEIAKIEFEGGLSISSHTNLNGKSIFDIKQGIILKQKTTSISSILSDQRITKIINKKLLFIK